MTTTDLIETAMAAKGWGVATLAKATGMARITLTRRLVDPASFSIRELSLVADALDIPFADLAESTRVASAARRPLAS